MSKFYSFGQNAYSGTFGVLSAFIRHSYAKIARPIAGQNNQSDNEILTIPLVLLANEVAHSHIALHIAPARLDDVAVSIAVVSVVLTTRAGG